MGDRFHKNVTADKGDTSGFSMGPQFKTIPIATGLPNIMRLVEPSKFVKYYESWIVCDDGVKRPFIVGMEDENDNTTWNVLMEIIGDPGEKRWFKGGILESRRGALTGKQEFIWESKAPDVFMKVKYNGGDLTGADGSWKPKPLYAFNAVSRSGETNPETGIYEYYSQINKKTQVLKAGQMIYNNIVMLGDNNGDLDTYDINISKTGSGKTDTVYAVYKAEKEKYPNTVIGGLSAEEKAYALWDLAGECKVTDATTILTYLEKTIADVDRAMGSSFIKRLKADAPNYTASPTITASAESSEPSAQPPVRSVAPAVAKPAEAKVVSGHVCHNCKTAVSDDAVNCPKCQTQVGGPCQECGKVFSVYDSKCPHCGKDFGTI